MGATAIGVEREAVRLVIMRSLQWLSSVTKHPLFSIATTTSILVLLYLPRPLLPFLFSPVPICALLLLAVLLRSGTDSAATHEPKPPPPTTAKDLQLEPNKPNTQSNDLGYSQNPIFPCHFVGWCRGGPLEVIYEEYEGEEEDEHDDDDNKQERSQKKNPNFHNQYAFCFTDSDTGSEEDDDGSPIMTGWDSPENLCFRWVGEEDEEEEEEMIEISLDEDNLIEIDLSSCSCR